MTLELRDDMRLAGHPHILGSECDVLHVTEAAANIRRKVELMLTCGDDLREAIHLETGAKEVRDFAASGFVCLSSYAACAGGTRTSRGVVLSTASRRT